MNAPTSVFDPATFASMVFTESNSTESTPIPAGEWPFTITKTEIVAWSSKDKTKAGLKLVCTLETEHPEIAQATGRPKNTAKDEIMLDLTPEGGLDFGKGMNVRLGRLRAATHLNTPGQPFSFDMLMGREATYLVVHEPYEERMVHRIKGVVADVNG